MVAFGLLAESTTLFPFAEMDIGTGELSFAYLREMRYFPVIGTETLHST